MSSDIAISVENLSKCFHIYSKPSDRLKQMLFGGKKQYFNEFWAVKDISFDIKKGETIGIVGRNGSGKSTLLQLVCGILEPTGGSIKANGRIAALLELGSGFNPEFTGRDNVYMNATILGLSRSEIDARFDDIAEFADIGQFIEQPVKTYSSGMMMRLAFAVAINVEPQILIIDEALSVGDELFQRKCFARIQKIKENGATILFVSHSGGTVMELCDRAILLHAGELILSGSPKQIIGNYQRLLYAPQEKHLIMLEDMRQFGVIEDVEALVHEQQDEDEVKHRDINKSVVPDVGDYDFFDPNLISQSELEYQSKGAMIESIAIVGPSGQPVNVIRRGNEYTYRYQVRFNKPAFVVRAGAMLKTVSGLELGGLLSHEVGNGLEFVDAGEVLKFSFGFKCALMPGTYFFNAGIVGNIDGAQIFLHRIVDALPFIVVNESNLCVTGIVDFSIVDASHKVVEIVQVGIESAIV
jgi:lipopolysaccharide transport system ATP-binding protein